MFWKNNETEELQPNFEGESKCCLGKRWLNELSVAVCHLPNLCCRKTVLNAFYNLSFNPFLSNQCKQNIVKGLIFTEIFPAKLDLPNPTFPSRPFFFFKKTVSNQCLITWLLHGTTFETLLTYWSLNVHCLECSANLDGCLVSTTNAKIRNGESGL